MATTSDIKNGLCIEMNNDIWTVKEFQHVKPGKGNAFVRMKIKSLTNGKVVEHTVPAGHKLNDVRVERRQAQYLYNDGEYYYFMNLENHDTLPLGAAMLDRPDLLKESEMVTLLFHAAKDEVLTCEMPATVVLQVTSVEPGVKGDTATNTTTPCNVETGAMIRVPLFIKEGDFIKIDTATGAYLERVKV